MNKIKVFVLLLPFVVLCSWALYYACIVKNSPTVTLPITGYDPRDLLSGHYIEFRIDWAKADCYQLDWDGVCPKADFAGVTRFYVPERNTRELERIINDRAHKTEIKFSYKDSKTRPIPKELLIDGKSWRER